MLFFVALKGSSLAGASRHTAACEQDDDAVAICQSQSQNMTQKRLKKTSKD
jgi:hypothetical protein